MTLLIKDEDVRQILTLEETIKAVEDAYRQYGNGLAGENGYGFGPPPKRELRLKGKGLPHADPQTESLAQGIASLDGTNMVILQHAFNFGKRRGGGLFHLLDKTSGETLAIITNYAEDIWWLRSGAAGAVAAKYLSNTDSRIAGVIGTGRHGRAHLIALSQVRNLEKAFAHSGRRKDEVYAREMSQKLGIDVIATEKAEEVVQNAEVLVTVTPSTKPIVKGEWLPAGLHINAIGADCPLKMELYPSALQKADKLIIDGEQVLVVGELRIPMEQGVLSTEKISTIGEVVAGVKPGRETSSEITIFESSGLTLSYVTICAKIYEEAQKRGLGKEIISLI